MSARDAILAAVRGNRPSQELPRPDVPFFDRLANDALVDEFRRRLEQMGGRWLDPGPAEEPLIPARARIAQAGIVCSNVAALPGTRALSAGDAPASLHDVDLAVVRAAFGFAETGSVAFSERELVVNTIGYLAQHLLVLLDPADIVGNLHHAYARPEMHAGHYLVFQTGPSATADIEGVLIHGAQGVRSLTVMLVARTVA